MSILKDLLALNQPAETITEGEDLDPDMAGSMAEELQDLHEQMVKIMSKVRENVRSLPRHMRGQAEAYWIPHIMIALGGEHEWMTAGHESTMQKLIDELREEGQEHDGDDDDHPEHGINARNRARMQDDDGDHEYR
jgi:hypothetical protein